MAKAKREPLQWEWRRELDVGDLVGMSDGELECVLGLGLVERSRLRRADRPAGARGRRANRPEPVV